MDTPLDPMSSNNGSRFGSKSFLQALKNGSSDNVNKVNLAGFNPIPNVFHNPSSEVEQSKEIVPIKSCSWINGKPTIILSDKEVDDLSKPLQLTLIGKFPAGCPKWAAVQSFFVALKLKGDYRCVNMDVKHIIIHFSNVEDYIRLFSKQSIFVQGFLLKNFKWTKDLTVNAGFSFAPVWISFPLMSLHLYTHAMLFSIAAVFGTPLKLDYATAHWLRPECARVLAELDLRKKFEHELWIGIENSGYLQRVIFENMPGYCSHCPKIGHYDLTCFHLHPELKIKKLNRSKPEMKKSEEEEVMNIVADSAQVMPVSVKTVEISYQSGIQFDNNLLHDATVSLDSVLELQNNAVTAGNIVNEEVMNADPHISQKNSEEQDLNVLNSAVDSVNSQDFADINLIDSGVSNQVKQSGNVRQQAIQTEQQQIFQSEIVTESIIQKQSLELIGQSLDDVLQHVAAATEDINSGCSLDQNAEFNYVIDQSKSLIGAESGKPAVKFQHSIMPELEERTFNQ